MLAGGVTSAPIVEAPVTTPGIALGTVVVMESAAGLIATHPASVTFRTVILTVPPRGSSRPPRITLVRA